MRTPNGASAPAAIGHNNPPEDITPEQHDAANREMGMIFVRGLASEKASLDQKLGLREIRVLGALGYCMSSTEMRAWPSYLTISDLTGYGEDSIEHALNELVEHGYIFRERKQRAKGERPRVHYGLRALSVGDLDVVLTEAVRALRVELEDRAKKKNKPVRAPSPLAIRILNGEVTRQNFAGWQGGDPANFSGVTQGDPAKFYGVAHSSDPANFLGDPAKNTGVTPNHPANFSGVTGGDPAKSDPQEFYSKENKKKKGGTEKTDLFRPSIALPSRLKEIVDRTRAPASIEAFNDEISAALDRGITPAVLEGSLRSAVAWCESKGKTADADCLKSCLTFIRGSKNPIEQTIAPDARSAREWVGEIAHTLPDIRSRGWED